MAPTPLTVALRRTLAQVRHVDVPRPGAAPPQVARIYTRVERDFGMLAPPVALHAPAPDLLAAAWMLLRETLLAHDRADRAVKEAVATAVSRANTCPYCVEVHGATLGGLTDRGGGESADPRVRAAAEWGRAAATREGAARSPRPFPVAQLPELGGVAVTFHYLNRMVNVFLGESPLPPGVPAAARAGARRVLGRFLRPGARRAHRPGDSLDLLPAAPPPPELAWAAPVPGVARALGSACAAVDAAGARSVPAPVRALVLARLAAWDGDPPGLSRAWVEEAAAALPAADRACGRLALLTAMASYQVDDAVVAEFRAGAASDAALVAATSWASMAAARRVGSWLGGPAPTRR